MSMTDTLLGGFADPAPDTARAFRAILDAMSRPGTIVRLSGAFAPAPASPAMAAALLVLADATTPVHLAGRHDTPALRQWLAFHTGAPQSPRDHAAFGAGDWADLLPLSDWNPGSEDYPDRSATLIVALERLDNDGARLAGPGIEAESRLSLPDLAPLVWNARRFPLGLDLIFTCGDRLAALPRTTRVGGA
jgi:alpha-D-ribose 1-methylphosphonate 5-triphosphate synthase subunit PhnH